MEFGSKKQEIEDLKLQEIKKGEIGCWFGLTSTQVVDHLNKFKEYLPKEDKGVNFYIAEFNDGIYEQIKKHKSIPKLKIVNMDIFEMLKTELPMNLNSKQRLIRTPLFLYGHLDYCCSAISLIEQGFVQNIRWLSKWWAIKEVFYLDLTVSRWGDFVNMYSILMEQLIPAIWMQGGWQLDSSTIWDYCDSSPMTTAIYRFVKLNKRPHKQTALSTNFFKKIKR